MRNKISYLALALLLIAQAMAIGIAPGSIDTDFGKEKKVLIINNEHKELDIVLYAEGDLADYITLSQSMVHFNPDEDTKEIKIMINEPEEGYGKLTAELFAMELPKGTDKTIATRQAVVTKITATAPYPGKYADAKLKIPKVGEDEPVNFVIEILNRGQQQIDVAQARIEVYSPTNDLLVSLQSDEKPVKPGEIRELVATYSNGLPKGKYYARAVLDYDGVEVILEDTFEIGNMLVDLKNIYVKNFKLGEIAKFDIIVENMWNEQIPDVYADIMIRDQYGRTQTEFKTSDVDLSPEQTALLNAYWDTSEVLVGEYRTEITLHFLGNNVKKTMTLTVREDAIDIDFMPTALAIDQPAPTKRDSWIIVLIILSIVVNALLIIYFARRK